jgi:PPOX class probable F420-dependent enzyme
MGIAEEKTIALTTYRRNGEGVTTPVWVNQVSDGRIGFWTAMGTGKTKRLKNNPRVTVQACSASGKVKAGAPVLSGTAEMVQSGPLFDEVQALGRKKYGVMVAISRTMGKLMGQRKAGQTYGDTVVLVRLDD